MNLKQFGYRLRTARENLGMTQEDLAARLGKNQNSISAYENGTRAIRITDLPELAEVLSVPVAYFFGDDYPVDEATVLLSEFPPDKRKEIVARLRFELELQRGSKWQI